MATNTINGTNVANTLNGTTAADLINGLGGNDKLFGKGGADTLDGGLGNDTMTGGAGNDVYIANSQSDKITETAAGGTDTVRTSVTFSIAAAAYNHVENLTLTGATNINGTGNALANVLTGNTGNNRLDGGAGNDTVIGNAGADTLIGGAGTGADLLQGGTGNDSLNGGSGNDVLDGGEGADKMVGGAGDDNYRIDSREDTLTEVATGGRDTVFSDNLDVSLRDFTHIEDLTLDGANDLDGWGNELNNAITGNSGNNTLDGRAGNDNIKGGAGEDIVIGRAGSDTLDGGADSDVQLGGAGNDLLIYDAADGVMNGGADIDTLRVNGSGVTVNLDGRIRSIETLNLTGTGNNTLTVTSDQVKAQSGTDTLRVDGNAGDVVNAAGEWTFGGNVGGYNTFTKDGATLLVKATVTFLDANTAPVANPDFASAVEDGPVVTGSVATNDSDADFVGDDLTFTLNGSLAGLTLGADGSYSFNADHANYQSLDADDVIEVVANYTVSDGRGGSDSSTLTITITGTNDAPVAVADNDTVDEGLTVTGSVATNDTDVDATTTLTYAATTTDGLSFGTDGGYVFDATGSEFESLSVGDSTVVSVGYTVSDGEGGTASSTLNITVTGTNDAPVAVADNDTVDEGLTVTGSVATNDTDVDATTTLTYAATTTDGLSFGTDGGYVFDATGSEFESLSVGDSTVVSVGYTVSDGEGGTASSTLNITVTGTNDAPVAVADNDTVDEGLTVTGSVATNDTDVDATTTLTYAATTTDGLSFGTDGGYVFDATGSEFESLSVGDSTVVSVGYTVSDGEGGTASSTLNITVTGTNDAPVAVADNDTVDEGQTVTGSVATNDTDVDATTTLTYSSSAAGFVISTDGNYTFDATGSEFDSLSVGDSAVVAVGYTVSDGEGGTASGTLNVTVDGTNDPVTAVAEDETFSEDSSTSGALDVTDADANDEYTFALDATPAGLSFSADGTYSLVGGAFDSLSAGDSTVLSTGYTVDDGQGSTSASTFTITVTGENDAPVAGTDDATVDEGDTVTGSVAGNDSDVDTSTATTLTYSSSAAGFVISTDGNYTFDATGSEFDSLSVGDSAVVAVGYTVSDGEGGTASGTLNVTVDGTNDAPVAVADNDTVGEGLTVTGSVATNDTDVDATTTLTYSATTTDGLVFGTDGGYTFDATGSEFDSLSVGDSTVVSVGYTVSDGEGGTASGTLNITVDGTNDPVTAVAEDETFSEDASTSGALDVTDADANDEYTFALDATPAGLSFSANGTYSLVGGAFDSLSAGDTTVLSTGYTVDDGQGSTSASTFTITVTGENDAPVAGTDNDTVDEGQTVTGSVATNDTDVDATTTLTYSSSAAGFVISTDGNYTFDATGSEFDSLSVGDSAVVAVGYTVSDGEGGTASGTLNVTVDGTNDPVTAVAEDETFSEDSSTSGALDVTDADANDDYTFALDATPAGLSFSADGTYSLVGGAFDSLSAGDSTVLSTGYTVDDGQGSTSASTFTITVTGENDAPVAGTDDATVDEGDTVTGSVAGNDSDVDTSTATTLTYSSSAAGFTISTDGNYTFDATGSEFDSLSVGDSAVVAVGYTVSDGEGGTASGALNITVNGTNDAAVIGGETLGAVIEDSAPSDSGTLTVDDVDGADEFDATSTVGAYGSFSLTTAGVWTYDLDDTLSDGLTAGQLVTDSFTVTADDGTTSTVTVSVTGENDAALIGGETTGDVIEDGTVQDTDTLTIDDVDGADVFDAQSATLGDYGSFSLTTAGVWTYDLDDALSDVLTASEVVTDSFTVTADDGTTSTVTVSVTGANDAALIGGETTGDVTEDGAVQDTGTLTIDDVDGADVFDAQSATLGAYGSFSLTTAGVWTYDLDDALSDVLTASEVVTDSFTVTADDGTTSTVTVTVTGANDSPLVGTNTGLTVGDGANDFITGAMLNEADPDDSGAGLTYTLTDVTDNGTLFLDGNALVLNDTFTQADIDGGLIVYTHADNETITDSFGFSLADGGENGSTPATGTFNITITPDSTFTFTGSGAVIDLSTIPGTDIQTVDITGTGDNELEITIGDVLGASTNTDILVVMGDSGDEVTDTGAATWTTDVVVTGFTDYTSGGATVRIDDDITANFIV